MSPGTGIVTVCADAVAIEAIAASNTRILFIDCSLSKKYKTGTT
jgi:hypothetical protein